MVREPSFWIRLLLRIAALRASDAELGDVMEEYAGGTRGALWLCRQILSTLRRNPPRATVDERRPAMLSNLWSDVRYAARMFRRNPGFTVAAVAPIALGIGINTGIFSILNSLAFRRLPAPEAAELVSVHQQFRGITQRRVHGARSMFSMPEYRAYRDRSRTLAGLMAYSVPWTVTLGGDAPQEADAVFVTCNYFDVLQLRPAIGPGFTANCEDPNAAPQILLSHDLWTRAFAADRNIVGRTMTVNGHDAAVVGVAPEGFDGIDLMKAALFAPTSLIGAVRPGENYAEDPHTSWLTLVGRRKKDAGMGQVRAELAVIAGQIDQQQPGRATTVNVAPATSLSLPEARRDIFSVAAVVLGAFGLVLFIACANVANLLLARAAGRTKEIAVRLSVGASRGRLIQQLLTESALIAFAGGAAGSLFAWWSFRGLLAALLSSLPGTIPPLRVDATPNLTVLWFALGLTATTALMFGMVPALQASKHDVQTILKQQGPGAGRRTAGWLRGALVGAQVAVCMVLLISAGLLLRALYAVHTVEPGFDYRHVAVVSFDARGRGSDQRAVAFQHELLERLGALPGVEAIARAGKAPLSPGRRQTMCRLPGQQQWQEIDVNPVSPGYFSLIGIPIVRGRTFTTTELLDSPVTAIVTEATARRFWPGQEPIGRALVMAVAENKERSVEIVGVAKDAQVTGIADAESSYVYLPAGPTVEHGLQLLVQNRTDFAALAAGVRTVARELDPGVVVRVNRLEENLDFWRTVSRLIAALSGSLSLLALALASIGVYGVVSYVVSRRRREVGIRMALGASARDVQHLIIRQTLRPVAVGVLIGIAAAAAASRILQAVLFGVSPFDPVAFIGAPLFLLGIAVAATVLPTREALRVDPITTLRYE
ncbi:MAG TPA: ABC transporter permease [Vicinamibacterales bacterium]|nr:ABC transporter permease [Vicinamibacterales bacterium]